MKRFLFFLFILFILLLTVGCAEKKVETIDAEPVTEDMIEEDPIVEELPAEETEDVVIVETQEPEEEPGPEMSEKLSALLNKAKGLKPNFEYFYYDPAKGKLEYEHKVYLDKQLIRLPFPVDQEDVRFNYVLLDNEAMTAEGYCTFIEPYHCPGGQGPFALEYDGWHQPTIQDWIMDIEYAEIIADGHVSSTRTKVIEFEKDGDFYRINLDNFYGIPLKVEINPDSNSPVEHLFKEVVVSKLKEDDVLPPLPRVKP